MDVQVLASGSKGNCYRVACGGSPLLLDCGIPFAEIRKRLDFRTSEIAGCLLTHEHGDHARAVREVIRAGIDCYCSRGTADALGIDGHRVHLVKALQPVTIGAWRVLPFATVHDSEEPLGFVLSCGSERLLFATDTAYIKYRFSGLTYVMVECNYDLPTLKANVQSGLVDQQVKRRVLRSHMNLDTVKGFLRANDLRQVREIVLLHLSDDNSDAQRFKLEIQRITGKVVRIA